jgi:hypothetical protein
MPLPFVPLLCLLGIVVALNRRAGRTPRGDASERLLSWAVLLLPADREEWGRAMVGELDQIEGRGRRWRFALGCIGAALLMPASGRAAAAVSASAAMAAGAAGLWGLLVVRYQLGTVGWVWAAIGLVVLGGFVLCASTLVRHPGVVLPGLLAGGFVAVMWLAIGGFTFDGVVAPRTWPWAGPLLEIAVPVVVGVLGALWGGSDVGRRTARLAAVSASLVLYLYATIAVVVLGAGGPPGLPGASASATVSDRLGDNVIQFVLLLPIVTATVGWGAAAATARLRPAPAAAVESVPVGGPLEPAVPPPARQARNLRPALLGTVVAVTGVVAAASWLRG